MGTYQEFLEAKARVDCPSGFEPESIMPALFPFQLDIVSWACKRGRAAIFADCGLGKSPMQLEWARQVTRHTQGRVLILAPLAVAAQTKREAGKFGIEGVVVARNQAQAGTITVANYEMLDHFDAEEFAGVVIDESGILKNFTGAIRTQIIETFKPTPFKLACSATPAPNDYMELGNHAEFLGSMSRQEMLSMFFVHDGGETQQWRLKGHAVADFWRWVCSWAVMMRKPSDLGYSDEGFILPPIEYIEHIVEADPLKAGMLFDSEPSTLADRRNARRASIDDRVAKCAELVAAQNDQAWLVWCGLNKESEALTAAIPDAVEVTGSDEQEHKEKSLLAFANGDIKRLVSKSRIAGLGMNMQKCARQAFVGLSDSYEELYQSVRRSYRFGQTQPVEIHIITASTEGATLANVKRKERDAEEMARMMVEHMGAINQEDLRGTGRTMSSYARDVRRGDGWTMHLGDCVEVAREIESESIDFSVFSPPFASLYTYSASDRDMGNCLDHAEFFRHFEFLIAELLRVTKPGRLCSFHCMNLPTSKVRDGVIGLSDFRGQLIRAFQDAGWIYHSEVCIWKDPVTAMQRTKALGLLHKTIRKDSAMSRQGIPDYLVTMRKPGENAEPIAHTSDTFPVEEWQRLASPVWASFEGVDDTGFLRCVGTKVEKSSEYIDGGINPGDTLQRESAREEADERHVAPLQLEVIRRAIRIWTNPGDLVLSPFGGIGSEGYVAIQEGRRAELIELKRSYWEQACANLDAATHARRQPELFVQKGVA